MATGVNKLAVEVADMVMDMEVDMMADMEVDKILKKNLQFWPNFHIFLPDFTILTKFHNLLRQHFTIWL